MDVQGFSDTYIGDRTKSTSFGATRIKFGTTLLGAGEHGRSSFQLRRNFNDLSLEFDRTHGHERDVTTILQLPRRASYGI